MSHLARVVRVVVVLAALGALLGAGGCGKDRPDWLSKSPFGGRGGKAPANVLVSMQQAASFDTFNELIYAAGLSRTLQGTGPFTVLAPTDVAFARLRPGQLDELLQPGNQAALRELVLYHVVPRKLSREDLQRQAALTTLSGETIQVRPVGQTVMLNERVQIFTGDIPASNGVIHALDGVLMPPGK